MPSKFCVKSSPTFNTSKSLPSYTKPSLDTLDPSFTNLCLANQPDLISKQRYIKRLAKERQQFCQDFKEIQLSQTKALDEVRVARIFANPFLYRSEHKIIKLTPEEQKSVGSNPLMLWDKQVLACFSAQAVPKNIKVLAFQVKNGHIRRVVDDEVRSLVLEVSGTNVATTYITCPIKPRASLGIKLPFLVMIIKNMKKYFTFEIQILDDKDMHRRFRVSNFQSTTKVRPFCTTMPIGLSSGWNQIQFNLADFTKRAYGSTYLETTRVQVHANVRIRRIYFSDVLYSDDELPNEYKLFVPTPATQTSKAQTKAGAAKPKQTSEKKPSLELATEEPKIHITEEEIPSGAPPSPALPSAPDEQRLDSLIPEPSSEPAEIAEEVEAPSELTELEASAELPSEPPVKETEVVEEALETAPAEAGDEPPPVEGEPPAEPQVAEEKPIESEPEAAPSQAEEVPPPVEPPEDIAADADTQ